MARLGQFSRGHASGAVEDPRDVVARALQFLCEHQSAVDGRVAGAFQFAENNQGDPVNKSLGSYGLTILCVELELTQYCSIKLVRPEPVEG